MYTWPHQEGAVGIDVHIHDYYFVVGHVPLAVAILVLTLGTVLGAWKLAKFLWLMLAG
jgi:heme/copper-type cytochrome/quinol oxidase subunit 1